MSTEGFIKTSQVELVESGTNNDNTQWYKIYSDGFVEQGGIINTGTSNNTTLTINLPVTMKNTNYVGIIQIQTTGSPYNDRFGAAYVTMYGKTVSSFQIWAYNVESLKSRAWYIQGYKA